MVLLRVNFAHAYILSYLQIFPGDSFEGGFSLDGGVYYKCSNGSTSFNRGRNLLEEVR